MLLSLAFMHFFNLYVFWRIRRRSTLAYLPPPVAPQMQLPTALHAYSQPRESYAAVAALNDETRRVLELALFSLHLGTMLFFIHDVSKGQKKTRRLVVHSLHLITSILPIKPLLAAFLGTGVSSILAEAGLLDASSALRYEDP